MEVAEMIEEMGDSQCIMHYTTTPHGQCEPILLEICQETLQNTHLVVIPPRRVTQVIDMRFQQPFFFVEYSQGEGAVPGTRTGLQVQEEGSKGQLGSWRWQEGERG